MLKAMCNFGKSKKGFTLIELLIVVAIIAILAAIAIPQFSSYRKRGYNAAANSDLRNLRTTNEAMMADFSDYGSSQTAVTAAAGSQGAEIGPGAATVYLVGGKTTSTPQSSSLSPNVYTTIKVDTAALGSSNLAYTIVTTHTSGDNYYGADSDSTVIYRGSKSVATTIATATQTPTSASGDNFSGVTCGNCAAVWTSVQ